MKRIHIARTVDRSLGMPVHKLRVKTPRGDWTYSLSDAELSGFMQGVFAVLATQGLTESRQTARVLRHTVTEIPYEGSRT